MEEKKSDFANPYEVASAQEKGPVIQEKGLVISEAQSKVANPGPLGLLGFGMTTILLNLHNEGIIGLSIVIVSLGFIVGGLMQIIAGIFEMKNGNTFSGTAFTAYGFFWLSMTFIWINPFDMIDDADSVSMEVYLLIWGIFSLFMFIATLKHNRAIQVVFITLTLLFFGLAANEYFANDLLGIVTGYIGIFCGGSAIYNAVGQLLNGEYGREVIKLG